MSEPVELGALARAIRRKLELNLLAGWAVPLREAPRPPARPPARPGAHPPRPAASPPLRAAAAPPPPASGLPPPLRAPPAPTPGPPPAVTPPSGEAARRLALLEPIRREVEACELCGLCRTRTRTVFGAGNPCARLMFVGEAPGFDEDRQGEPFVGKAGQLLNDIIRAMRLRREDVYIANIIKCRPPQNRTPDIQETAACLPYLRRQIEVVSPEVLCALGAVAARNLLGTAASIGSLRGRFHDFQGIPVRVTYHPAYLLRNPADKRKTWEDVQEVMKLLGIRGS